MERTLQYCSDELEVLSETYNVLLKLYEKKCRRRTEIY